MGNTPSGEDFDKGDFDKEAFIEEQKKIIREQNEQIQKLASIAQNNINSNENIEKKKKSKINPYHELGISQNYDESTLKKAYLERAMITHPDRGGSKEAFQKVTVSYKALMIKLKNEINSHEHNDLRDNSQGFIKSQESDNYQNHQYKDLSKNFDKNIFNQIYEENRIEEVNDEGYGHWIKENEITNEDIIQNDSLTKDNFNSEFTKHKQKYLRKKGTQIQKFSEPNEEISFKNKSSIMLLGQGKVDDFSGETGSGLSFRDYRDAYTNTFLVSDEIINVNNRSKDLKGFQKERENISYEMNEKEMEIYALKKIREEKEEEIRVKRLQEKDEHVSNMYDKVHQRMLGH